MEERVEPSQFYRLPSEVSFEPDAELEAVLAIAAQVGDVGGDDVNVSYTSLLIGLLWSDGPTSSWLRKAAEEQGVRVEQIYRHRQIKADARQLIAKRVGAGKPPEWRPDVYSRSAITVLQEAGSIARETTTTPEPLAVRHVAAAYLFRNPPGHDRQLHDEWGFERESWRRAFAQFIGEAYEGEVDAWSQVLSGYVGAPDLPDGNLPGEVLGTYEFDDDVVRVLRTVEEDLGSGDVFTSERLLSTLGRSKELADCKLFSDEVAERFGWSGGAPSLVMNASQFGESGSDIPVTHRFKAILDRARTLARSITRTERVGARHVIASLVVAPDSTANRLLVDSGVSIPLLRQKLLKDFTRRWVDDDGGEWRFHLVGTTPPTIASYNSDEAKGEDKLDVTRYATAFATVVASRNVHPPLSIGIFGDWGSGKSFFMHLMRKETEKVCAIEETDDHGNRLFCRRVVPIEFNAWHYADTNLWASLVQTILKGLRKAMVGDEDESDLMDAVIDKLELAKEARKSAQERKESAEATLRERDEALETARETAKTKADALTTAKTKDVLAIVRDRVMPDAEVADALRVAEDYLGLDGLEQLRQGQDKNVGELMELTSDARVVAARLRSSWSWLARAPVSWKEVRLLVGVALGILVVGLVLAVAFKGRIEGAWPTVATVVAQVGAVVAMVTRWAKGHLSKVAAGLDQFDKVRQDVDAKLADERAQFDRDVAAAQEARDAAAAKANEAQAALEAAQEEADEAEAELRESGSAHRIARLVEQRLKGGDYEKYLGIVAAIREDFQTLTDLMKKMRKSSAPTGDLEPVDRIVLYIDDLDRCPTDKVVSVLEAIHLLLAFELFVVVVGVDIRWAARSLHEKYPQHLAAGVYESGAGEKKSNHVDGASALDYLEKIFQIPFWLPPMDEEASRNMIGELVPPTRQTTTTEEGAGGTGERQPRPGGADTTVTDETAPETAQAGSEETSQAEKLVIEPEERSFMLRLAGAVGKSPRRLKRFVNTYRILKASINALERETFVLDHGKEGEYRAAMTLLALVSGAPRSALEILSVLDGKRDEDELQGFEPGAAAETEYVEAALDAYRKPFGEEAPRLRDLRYWGRRVVRFSFRSGRG